MNLFSKLKNMKILLIDDDEWIRDSMQLFFEGEGCHLLAIGTAEEGRACAGLTRGPAESAHGIGPGDRGGANAPHFP